MNKRTADSGIYILVFILTMTSSYLWMDISRLQLRLKEIMSVINEPETRILTREIDEDIRRGVNPELPDEKKYPPPIRKSDEIFEGSFNISAETGITDIGPQTAVFNTDGFTGPDSVSARESEANPVISGSVGEPFKWAPLPEWLKFLGQEYRDDEKTIFFFLDNRSGRIRELTPHVVIGGWEILELPDEEDGRLVLRIDKEYYYGWSGGENL